jgi:hypothetical protein
VEKWNDQANRAGDTDRHWQLGAEGALRVLERRNRTGTTQPLSQLSAELAAKVLRRPPPVHDNDLPSVMVDPDLAPPAQMPAPVVAQAPAGWMYRTDASRPSLLGDDELRAATARPFSSVIRFFGRIFRN